MEARLKRGKRVYTMIYDVLYSRSSRNKILPPSIAMHLPQPRTTSTSHKVGIMSKFLSTFKRPTKRHWRSRAIIRILYQQRWFILSILTFVLYTVFGHTRQNLQCFIPSIAGHPDEPPTWNKLRQWEDDLPQHSLDLPFPEGRNGRYVLFSNQIQKLGWNNQLNEV